MAQSRLVPTRSGPSAVPASDANTISLSLVSHTNVGKTTLARTLLSQSVGEVRDEPHVTDTADRFELAETPQGDLLLLWDTPGFGDSARLARRLIQSDKPIGWFVSQVWDRFADRALWSSQQAVHNVREEADVVLYLVNAAENPEDAGYVEPEMKILAWIGKPIIVLLNQMGPPAGHSAEEAEIERWRTYLTRFGNVHQVLALDAFARCWVQEGALLQAVEPLLPQDKREAFARLNRLWQNQRRQTFDQSMHLLATRLAGTALDRERISNSSLKDQLREVGKVLGVTRSPQQDAKQVAMNLLAERLNDSIRQSTDELIKANGLTGHATDEVLSRMADHYDVTENLNEGHAAVVGGIVTGAIAGLKADFLAGGLTLGGGMIAGGVLGALGGAGLARGYNMVRGIDAITVTWTDAVMNRLVQSSLLTYLAVAHYGRGRGDWAQSEHPAHWEKTVTDVLARQHDQFTQFWRKRQNYGPDKLAADLQTELTLAMERILIRLYPNALSMAALGSGAKRLNIALAADLAEARGDHAHTRKAPPKKDEPTYAADLRAGFAAARRTAAAQAASVAAAQAGAHAPAGAGYAEGAPPGGGADPAGRLDGHEADSENSLLESALDFFDAAGPHADEAGASDANGVNTQPRAGEQAEAALQATAGTDATGDTARNDASRNTGTDVTPAGDETPSRTITEAVAVAMAAQSPAAAPTARTASAAHPEQADGPATLTRATGTFSIPKATEFFATDIHPVEADEDGADDDSARPHPSSASEKDGLSTGPRHTSIAASSPADEREGEVEAGVKGGDEAEAQAQAQAGAGAGAESESESEARDDIPASGQDTARAAAVPANGPESDDPEADGPATDALTTDDPASNGADTGMDAGEHTPSAHPGPVAATATQNLASTRSTRSSRSGKSRRGRKR